MVRELSPRAAFGKGLPDIRSLAADVPGFDSTKRFFHRSVDKVQGTVGDLLDKVTPEDVPLPRGVDFGKLGRKLVHDSPLGDFLGKIGLDTGPMDAPNAKNTSGSRIPGGPSLYSEGRGMYHKGAPGAPDTYAFENTPEGIKFAADNGYESIDLDILLTKDGHMVATHYHQPMKKDKFYDPLGKIDPDTKVSEMTLAEVRRLRNEDGQSQIYPMSMMIEHLKKNGIAGDLEAKSDPRFGSDKVMGELAGMVREAGIRANLKAIDRGDQSHLTLETAQRHGFWVRTAAGNDRKGRHFGYGS